MSGVSAVQPRADDPLRGILLMLLALVLFSISDGLSKLLSQTLPPLEVVWLRYLTFMVPVAFVLARRGGGAVLRPRAPRLQVLRGLCVVVSAISFTSAISVLQLAEAISINFVAPAFITILSVVFLGEKVGWRRWTAIGVGLLGVLIVLRPGSGLFQPAALLPIITAASWAAAIVCTRRMAGSDSTETTLVWSAVTGFLVLTLLLPLVFVAPSWREVGIGLCIGIFSAIPHSIVVIAYRFAPASTLAPFGYTQIVFMTTTGWVLFGALPDLWTVAGACVIVGSGLYTAHREGVRAREKRAG